eukprot:5753057-Amphidinium_carterae.1
MLPSNVRLHSLCLAHLWVCGHAQTTSKLLRTKYRSFSFLQSLTARPAHCSQDNEVLKAPFQRQDCFRFT